jgi:hypothetical protein
MKPNIENLPPAETHPVQLSGNQTKTNLDTVVLMEFALGTLAGVIAYTAAVVTTVVESPGFWRVLWLCVCLAAFACASGLIIQGARNFGKH